MFVDDQLFLSPTLQQSRKFAPNLAADSSAFFLNWDERPGTKFGSIVQFLKHHFMHQILHIFLCQILHHILHQDLHSVLQ